MKQKLYYYDHQNCSNCTEQPKGGFTYRESKAGERYVFENIEHYTLIFILSGRARISCNEFSNHIFEAGYICLLPIAADCIWETLEDSSGIVLLGDNEMTYCDRASLQNHAERWLNSLPAFNGLIIKPRLSEFLETIKNYVNDGIECPYMHHTKQRELSMIFRAYYSSIELTQFFLPTVKYVHEFEQFIMKNYLKMKGVKEFVDLSGLNTSTFNRRFKAHFGESPYQWMIKQKSKHIYHQLSVGTKTIAEIMREFDFSDASHFNRYCKTIFGASPTELRSRLKNQQIKTQPNFQEQLELRP